LNNKFDFNHNACYHCQKVVLKIEPKFKKITMAKPLQLKSKTTRGINDDYFSDSDLMTLVTLIINEKPQFQNIRKGVWAWNQTDKRFSATASFRRMMAISPFDIPDLDFWIEKLAADDFIKFADTLEGVYQDAQSRACIFKITNPDSGQRIIQCFLENMKSPTGKKYIVGVFCDISEYIFSDNRN
jgi:hypothetical protein